MFKAVKIVLWKYLIIKIISVKKYKFLTTKKNQMKMLELQNQTTNKKNSLESFTRIFKLEE